MCGLFLVVFRLIRDSVALETTRNRQFFTVRFSILFRVLFWGESGDGGGDGGGGGGVCVCLAYQSLVA